MNEYSYLRIGKEWVIGIIEDDNPFILHSPMAVMVLEADEDGTPTTMTLTPFDPCNVHSVVLVEKTLVNARAYPNRDLINAYEKALEPPDKSDTPVLHH